MFRLIALTALATDRVLDWTARALMILAAAGLVAVALMIGADVVSRGLFGRGIIGVAEVVGHALLMTAFLQIAYSVRIGSLLRTEIIDTFLPKVVAPYFWLLGYLLGALLFALIAYYTWDPMVTSWVRNSFEGHASLRVPKFPAQLAIVVCSSLAVVNFLALSIRAIGVCVTGDRAYMDGLKQEDSDLG